MLFRLIGAGQSSQLKRPPLVPALEEVFAVCETLFTRSGVGQQVKVGEVL